MNVYLCHKCGGTLTSQNEDSTLYGCDCMSGWVRDWQHPIPIAECRAIQIRHCMERLALYRRQGRSEEHGYIPQTILKIIALRGRAGERA
jgi:hypothetical protein